VHADDGFLAQIRVLEQIGREDNMIGWIIVLIDVASCALELAAVLGKVLSSFVASKYSALLARDDYIAFVTIADETAAEPDRRERKEAEILPPDKSPGSKQASPAAPHPFDGANDNVAPPVKRPRGRPRKHPLPPAIKGANGQED
jgi:hypothetical protein